MMRNYQKILLSSFILTGLFSFNLVLAGFHTGPLVPCGTSDSGVSCSLCHLWQLADNLINFISFNLAIPIAAILFVAAGILFLFAQGDKGKIETARKIFTNVVIGLLIIFCSWLLVDTFIKTLASTKTESGIKMYYSWNEFPDCTSYRDQRTNE